MPKMYRKCDCTCFKNSHKTIFLSLLWVSESTKTWYLKLSTLNNKSMLQNWCMYVDCNNFVVTIKLKLQVIIFFLYSFDLPMSQQLPHLFCRFLDVLQVSSFYFCFITGNWSINPKVLSKIEPRNPIRLKAIA